MSVFNELLPKLSEISNSYINNFNDDLKVALQCLDKFAEEYHNGRKQARETLQKNKNLTSTLQCINEDEDESPKDVRLSNGKDGKKRLSNKRSKEEVDGMSSPEQEKRQKRNASVKAQNNISKQVNVNLTQKLRREDTTEKPKRRGKEDKENAAPMIVKIKQEKISIAPEPMELESTLNVEVKQEVDKDEFAMPPPVAPVPKPRKLVQKEKSEESEEELPSRRTTRTRKQTDTMPPPPVPAAAERQTRASRRATKQTEPPPAAPAAPEPVEARPKRTRAKKKASESSTTDSEAPAAPVENGIGSPAEKPRPKRTRRGQKAAEKEMPKQKEATPEPEVISLKEEKISIQPENQSPVIPQKVVKKTKIPTAEGKNAKKLQEEKAISLEETHIISSQIDIVSVCMDKTVVIQNGECDHNDGVNIIMNETVVLEKVNRETMVLDKPQNAIMDATVVIDKEQQTGTPNITDDMSILTDDDSEAFQTPPKDNAPPEPSSAVKAKVQQFEEMAARTTRTKTRAMAKKEDVVENCTPPEKINKQVLSAETLNKMNNMIFNGKTQISSSAIKPTAKLPPPRQIPASASKVTAINKAREAEEALRSKDDAKKKKEALLEAKKEQQRRKREEKMAAAAAARDAAERERRAAMQAAAKERMEKQAHADQGKIERMKEAERKKQELARKVAETEERRRAEEQARAARLADEQRRADAARKKQIEETEAMKKEAAIMAKEIEKRQKEYLEKQKMKQRMEADKMHTPLKGAGTPGGKYAMEPVYMQDGFQHLNSDEDDDEQPKFPPPDWCLSKPRHRQLALQHLLKTSTIDRFFSVRVHSPDLRGIFPHVERRELKRTSSAVWRTPPALRLSRVQESPV